MLDVSAACFPSGGDSSLGVRASSQPLCDSRASSLKPRECGFAIIDVACCKRRVQATPAQYWADFDSAVKDGVYHTVTKHFIITASEDWAAEAG